MFRCSLLPCDKRAVEGCAIPASCVTDLTYTRGYAALQILFLTPRFPYPPLKGDTLRAYHQIRVLSEQGHNVTLLSLGTPSSPGDQEEMERWCVRVLCVPLSQNRARGLDQRYRC